MPATALCLLLLTLNSAATALGQETPTGYLRTAALQVSSDTFDTFTSSRGPGPRIGGGRYFVRTIRPAEADQWEISDRWYDSTATLTATQAVRTGRGTLATERETVRARSDSASLLISPGGIVGWVVPEGESPRLFDGPPKGARFTAAVVFAAIAKAVPDLGAIFEAPTAALYGPSPLVPSIDSLRVVARDTVMRGTTAIPVLVIQRTSGTRHWIDATTGIQVAARGNAGPQRWWWHLRRGVRLPKDDNAP